MSHPIIPLQQLFEALNARIDKPIEYNHILASALAQVGAFQIFQVDGVPYVEDPSRGKSLSLARPHISGGFYGPNASNIYLKVDGNPTMGEVGYPIIRDATITAMWGKSRSLNNWTIEARVNGIPITVASIPVNAGYGANTQLNVDLSAGDILQFYLNGSGVKYPMCGVEIAWRTTI